MLLGDPGSLWRCLFVWASGTSTLGTVALLLAPDAIALCSGHPGPASLPFDLLLRRVSEVLLLGCAGWAWLALTATVAGAWRGVPSDRRRPWRLPPGVRRVVLAGCGVALTAGVAVPADAHEGRSGRQAHGMGVLSGLPLPERAVAPPMRSSSRHPPPARVVPVRPGDTLWAIAERGLPDGSPDQVIAARWHAIYDANRRLIGPDPDVIEPGQHLLLPPTSREDRR